MAHSDKPLLPPLVSVIIPIFNAKNTLSKTLDAVLEQTLENIEIICVDDCSTDGSLDVVNTYAARDTRVRAHRLTENQGVATARNAGITVARGRYICFLDADDWWHKDKLKVQVDFMINAELILSYMDYQRVHSDTGSMKNIQPPSSVTYATLLHSNHIGNLTAMVLRDLVDAHNIRFEKVGHEDYLFWLAVVKRSGIAYRVPYHDTLCFYRIQGKSLSANKVRAASWQWRIYRKHLNFSVLKASYHFAFYSVHAILKRFPSTR